MLAFFFLILNLGSDTGSNFVTIIFGLALFKSSLVSVSTWLCWTAGSMKEIVAVVSFSSEFLAVN